MICAALEATERDPAIDPHLDLARPDVAGFSAGGFTALVAAGARVDRSHFAQFCAANPDDGVCRPQQEFAVTPEEFAKALKPPEVAAEVAHAGTTTPFLMRGPSLRWRPPWCRRLTRPALRR
jgi:predicted dienelactone hydrolase